MASRYVAEEDLVDLNPAPKEEKFVEDEAGLELHRVVFHGDLKGAADALERGAEVSAQDRHGKLSQLDTHTAKNELCSVQ